MTKIVIIGGGLTGLSTAYHLEKNNFFDYKIFEKENEIGGLCRSVYQDGFTFDYTGHLLHVNDSYFEKFINDIVGKENLNNIHRRSFVYSQDVYTRYPYQINMYGLPQETIVECIEKFILRHQKIKNPKTFYQWVLKNFGEGFLNYFFEPFQSKILAYDIKKISPEWAEKFVPKTTLKDIISGTIKEPQDSKLGYNSQFYYPKENGIFFFIKRISQQLINPIYTNHNLKEINLKNKEIIFSNGHNEYFDILINTIPLDKIVSNLNENSNTTFAKSSNKLICNSIVNFNLGISKPELSSKHWIYIPETKYPFYRIGFSHNFAKSLVPEGCSALYGEFSHINKTDSEVNELLKKSICETKKLFDINNNEIITQKIINISHAYVIYNFWRQKNLPNLLTELKNNSIYSIGRYGSWKYSSMQDAILDGKKVVEEILSEKIKLIPAKKIESEILPRQIKIEKIKELQ